MSDTIRTVVPDSHLDLLRRPLLATMVTLLPSGRPQASVVWYDYDELTGRLLLNSERGRLKVANLERDPRVTLLIVDPDDQDRYLELRCDVEDVTEDGALEHRAALDLRYLGADHYTDPALDRGERVIITLRPVRAVAF